MKLKKSIKNKVKSIMNKLPYVKSLYRQTQYTRYPNGHYYSPVVAMDEIKQRESEIWKDRTEIGIHGIDLNTNYQLELSKKFSQYYSELPYGEGQSSSLRYQFKNGYYSYTDAIVLYATMRHYKPKRIIEIGSGFSSAVMLDVNEHFFNSQIAITFIDPYPERLHMLMDTSDQKENVVIDQDVQNVPIEKFECLEAGDILFVDSTHVSKTGSDVNYILFKILPSLKPGVLVHFHDIFYPFEYPKDWVYLGLNWNENYILKAFLMYNTEFKITFFAEYLHTHHKEAYKEMPLCYEHKGANLWIERK